VVYTLDGSEPTASSTVYTGPVALPGEATTVLKARCVRGGKMAGQTASTEFQTNPPVPPKPDVYLDTLEPVSFLTGWQAPGVKTWRNVNCHGQPLKVAGETFARGAGRVILLAPGRYFHAAAISLDGRDRGLPIKGEQPGAIAEIYGGLAVNGWTMSEGPFKSAAESYVNKGHRIESNLIYDCSKLVGGGGGMQIYQSGGNFSLPMMPATT